MGKCIGTGNSVKCERVATVKVRGSKTLSHCVPCLRERHANKMAADAIHAATQRAAMAAFKAGR
jgi:hypothetical protein